MKYLKKLLFLAVCILFNTVCIAQVKNKDFEKFTDSFDRITNFPNYLMTNIRAASGLIKIEVNPNGGIVDISFSDSVDSLLNSDFKKNKKLLDTASLAKYFKTVFADNKNRIYLIPFSFSFHEPLGPQTFNFDKLKEYSNFNGQPINGDVTILRPLNYIIRSHR